MTVDEKIKEAKQHLENARKCLVDVLEQNSAELDKPQVSQIGDLVMQLWEIPFKLQYRNNHEHECANGG